MLLIVQRNFKLGTKAAYLPMALSQEAIGKEFQLKEKRA
jgi:hypothetical protein